MAKKDVIEFEGTVVENLPNVTDSQTMFDEVLSKTKFSLAYDPTNEWCSEFTSESEKYGDLTVDTPADEFKEILEDYAEKYQTIEDKRDDETLSYSAHSSVYDLNTLSDNDINNLGINRDLNTFKTTLTNRGLTCK